MQKQIYRDNSGALGCDSTTIFDEFIRGSWNIDGETVTLNGTYVDSAYRNEIQGGCHNAGKYQAKFSWHVKKDILTLKEDGNTVEERFSQVSDVPCD